MLKFIIVEEAGGLFIYDNDHCFSSLPKSGNEGGQLQELKDHVKAFGHRFSGLDPGRVFAGARDAP